MLKAINAKRGIETKCKKCGELFFDEKLLKKSFAKKPFLLRKT